MAPKKTDANSRPADKNDVRGTSQIIFRLKKMIEELYAKQMKMFNQLKDEISRVDDKLVDLIESLRNEDVSDDSAEEETTEARAEVMWVIVSFPGGSVIPPPRYFCGTVAEHIRYLWEEDLQQSVRFVSYDAAEDQFTCEFFTSSMPSRSYEIIPVAYNGGLDKWIPDGSLNPKKPVSKPKK